ncbi:MAG: SDR family oxidoreductase [Oscillospiraceae bacterium]|nr:SDR family oxidoreductase [Oscillospiraceae bacterium]
MNYNVDFDEDLMSMGNIHATHVKPLSEIYSMSGKNVIVTGGTTGLGYAIANRFAEAGAKVVIVGRSAEKGAVAEKQFRDRGFEVTYCQADITEVSECEKAVKFMEDTYGPVDVLVNNAARWIFSALVDQPEEYYDQTMDLNVKAYYFMAKYAARSMIKNRRPGKIVNVASTAYVGVDFDNVGLLTTYNTSKGAVVSMTLGLAKELKQYGINVNCVAPGGMDTYGNESDPVGLGDYLEKYGMAISELTASGGENPYCNPDEVALVVFFFATDGANYLYGETIKASGGSGLSFQKMPIALSMDIPEDYTAPRKLHKKADGTVAYDDWYED